ncbi:hypothetical protein ON010_g3269 [Phytophthora cinnamomi]|nr:hypothetical protein ON010_g3269 [Phytophthora cinnamomi]
MEVVQGSISQASFVVLLRKHDSFDARSSRDSGIELETRIIQFHTDLTSTVNGHNPAKAKEAPDVAGTDQATAQEGEVGQGAISRLQLDMAASVSEVKSKPRKCYVCGSEKHLKATCPGWNNVSGKRRADYTLIVLDTALVAADYCDSKDYWIFDSASSRHRVNDERLLEKTRECSHMSLGAGGGEEVIKKHGSVLLQVDLVGQKEIVRLKNVQFAPKLARKLISYGYWRQTGMRCRIEAAAHRDRGDAVLSVDRKNSVLVVWVTAVPARSRRYGPLDADDKEQLLPRLPGTHEGHSSRKIHDVPEFFEKKLNYRIHVLRTDGGGEYRVLDPFYGDAGVRRQISEASNQASNGKAERMHRAILNMLRCMVFESSVERKVHPQTPHQHPGRLQTTRTPGAPKEKKSRERPPTTQ